MKSTGVGPTLNPLYIYIYIYKERFPFRIPFYSNGCDCKCCTVCELVHVPSPQFEAFCIPGAIGSLNDSLVYMQQARNSCPELRIFFLLASHGIIFFMHTECKY